MVSEYWGKQGKKIEKEEAQDEPKKKDKKVK